MIDTANNATAVRKITLQIVHLSEIVFYRNFGEMKQALFPAIAHSPEHDRYLKTMANGINDVSTSQLENQGRL